MTEKHQAVCGVDSPEDISQEDRECTAGVDGEMPFEQGIISNSHSYLEKSHKIVVAILDEISVEFSEREEIVYQMIRSEYVDRDMICH